MIHIALHFIVPLVVAYGFYRDRWRYTTLILIATMLVDIDHLLATPIYDPERCSIGFHPLHTWPAIVIYCGLFLLPLISKRKPIHILHLIGLGLLIHMLLDGTDCLL